MLKALPHDGPAERDAGRAATAAGQFEYAAEALEKAHHFEGHKPDPELHYLRGEALFTLGRDEEAFREHRIAELEIGPDPEDRMRSSGWRASTPGAATWCSPIGSTRRCGRRRPSSTRRST